MHRHAADNGACRPAEAVGIAARVVCVIARRKSSNPFEIVPRFRMQGKKARPANSGIETTRPPIHALTPPLSLMHARPQVSVAGAMSRAQRAALLIVLAIDLALIVYPPFQQDSRFGTLALGHHWIFADFGNRGFVHVDHVGLTADVTTTSVVGLIAFVACKRRSNNPSQGGIVQ